MLPEIVTFIPGCTTAMEEGSKYVVARAFCVKKNREISIIEMGSLRFRMNSRVQTRL